MEFKQAVNIIIQEEGGYVNDPHDPGGETKYGISKRAYPEVDIGALTKSCAKKIYKADYWDACRCSELPENLRLIVFDCAVNQGVAMATKFLQRCFGVNDDGLFGPLTLAAVCENFSERIIEKYAMKRLEHYQRNRNFIRYGRGWTKRLLRISILTKF